MSQCCSVTSCSCSAGCGDDVQQRYSSWDREKGCIDLTLTMMLGEHGIIFKAHPDEPLRHSIMFICPLLPVARQSKRKDFCKSLSDFSRQFNNFFLRKTKNKKNICFPSKSFCSLTQMTWFLDCSLQEEKPDRRQLFLSSGNYNSHKTPGKRELFKHLQI